MPSMANITVKDASNADVVFNAAVPSAGDRTPARWNANAVSAIAGFRPTATVVTRDNGRESGRVLEGNAVWPFTQTVSGVETSVARMPFKVSTTLPTNVPASSVLNAWVVFANFYASALMRQVAEEGYAPT